MNIFNSIKHVIKESLFLISPSIFNKIQNFNRNYVYKKRLELQLKNLPARIANYYRDTNNDEIKDIISFIEKNGIHMIPYEFILKYNSEDVNVYYDDERESIAVRGFERTQQDHTMEKRFQHILGQIGRSEIYK